MTLSVTLPATLPHNHLTFSFASISPGSSHSQGVLHTTLSVCHASSCNQRLQQREADMNTHSAPAHYTETGLMEAMCHYLALPHFINSGLNNQPHSGQYVTAVKSTCYTRQFQVRCFTEIGNVILPTICR